MDLRCNLIQVKMHRVKDGVWLVAHLLSPTRWLYLYAFYIGLIKRNKLFIQDLRVLHASQPHRSIDKLNNLINFIKMSTCLSLNEYISYSVDDVALICFVLDFNACNESVHFIMDKISTMHFRSGIQYLCTGTLY